QPNRRFDRRRRARPSAQLIEGKEQAILAGGKSAKLVPALLVRARGPAVAQTYGESRQPWLSGGGGTIDIEIAEHPAAGLIAGRRGNPFRRAVQRLAEPDAKDRRPGGVCRAGVEDQRIGERRLQLDRRRDPPCQRVPEHLVPCRERRRLRV